MAAKIKPSQKRRDQVTYYARHVEILLNGATLLECRDAEVQFSGIISKAKAIATEREQKENEKDDSAD